LAAATVRIDDPANVRVAIDQLLREANRRATQLIRPGAMDLSAQIVQITNLEVEQLINQIGDGEEYVVRIFSVANYLIGEQAIQVSSNVVPNQIVFGAGDVVAATSLDPSSLSDQQIQQRLNLLIAAANFRANSLGILTDSVEVGRIQNVIAFIEQLKQVKATVELKAIAAETTSTAGPLKIELVAAQDGQVLFRTKAGLEPSAGNRLNGTGTIAPEKIQE
jgi:uncharacterized protein (DUF3084 family)